MKQTLINKINYSIDLIQRAEKLALKYNDYGFHLAFSGGKDSIVLYHIAKQSGVKFKAFMQVTTIDPPELMKYIRKNYPDVTLQRPKINFYNLIKKKKSLPTRVIRYCCSELKEQSGANSVVLTGIRKAESVQRSKRNEFEMSKHKFSGTLDQFNTENEINQKCIKGKDKFIINPIIHWTDNDVWEYIKHNNIEYCKLYDEGKKRIGCIFCPMASVKEKKHDLKKYPKIAETIKKSIQYLIDNNNFCNNFIQDKDVIFDWWINNDSQINYLLKQKQTEIEF